MTSLKETSVVDVKPRTSAVFPVWDWKDPFNWRWRGKPRRPAASVITSQWRIHHHLEASSPRISPQVQQKTFTKLIKTKLCLGPGTFPPVFLFKVISLPTGCGCITPSLPFLNVFMQELSYGSEGGIHSGAAEAGWMPWPFFNEVFMSQ